MKPVPEDRVASYREFFASIVKELNLSDQLTPDECMESILRGYGYRYLDMYMDDLENPKHCLVLSKYPGIVRSGTVANVILIYSVPEERGDKEALKQMMKTIENYAQIYGAKYIVAASWVYRDSRPIDSLWLSNGYEKESITYTKTL